MRPRTNLAGHELQFPHIPRLTARAVAVVETPKGNAAFIGADEGANQRDIGERVRVTS